MADCEEILDFWFGNLQEGKTVPPGRFDLWFGGAEATDRLIRDRFVADVELAATGGCDDWCRTARGTLALLLLLDQFPRNIYRGASRAYAFDEKARRLCLAGLAAGQDRRLATVERAFFYLPLEHAEDLALQRRSVAAFADLLKQSPAPLAEVCLGFLDYAERHLRIIERFGRFPHRNAPLGRPSTAEEADFLREPGSSF